MIARFNRMALLAIFALLLGFTLTSLTGCADGDDDDSAADDDDSAAVDDDDSCFACHGMGIRWLGSRDDVSDTLSSRSS